MKKIILVGKAASGKTTLAEYFESIGYKANLSVTTRPMREGEIHMVSYNFMSRMKFLLNRLLLRFWEVKKFNGWYYGTLKSEWSSKDIFIFTPSGIESMSKKDIKDSVIIYINTPEILRQERLLQRSDADSVGRRMAADDEDFSINSEYKKHLMLNTGNNDFCVKTTARYLLEEAGEDSDIIRAIFYY